ncbi:hypothetical protein [Dictyobacter kobayashii]|uniref:Uncharacterized protein n=1 Tax=Dictyobacter kobayashii TaxID=2014872 RepID=A0A402AWG5_9CHLR|nr:hypothetical protein [Dictyobacter kobayashii]GCE23417.1 hypothetical protein KDK_72170 [Dictyobacter kobayashii]
MTTRKKVKPTLAQVRGKYFFDIAALATSAEVGPIVIYHALTRQPIIKSNAEKILQALTELYQSQGQIFTLENVDIVLTEEALVLWIIRATHQQSTEQGTLVDEYYFVYARNQEHAETLSRNWLEQFSPLVGSSFTARPEGLQIGHIQVPGYLN